MLSINFSSANPLFNQAVTEYQLIWQEDGEKIIQTIEQISGLSFHQQKIQATIYEDMSKSHPLMLRASYPKDTKKSTLIHELCHILLNDNSIPLKKFDSHQIINLILYDIWVNLYGEDFAHKQMAAESNLVERYKTCWNWALSKTQKERQHLFQELIS